MVVAVGIAMQKARRVSKWYYGGRPRYFKLHLLFTTGAMPDSVINLLCLVVLPIDLKRTSGHR